MKLVFKSNNLVEISWVKYILDSNDIEFFVLDELMSINEGNISAIPIRILVKDNFVNKASQTRCKDLKIYERGGFISLNAKCWPI